MSSKTVPYENATSGDKARAETLRMLQNFGCESVGFMDDFAAHEVLLQFTHRGRQVQLRASAKGWAQMFIKARPHTYRLRYTIKEHEQRALKQGQIAVNSILRDWVKGQVTAVECGMLSFEAVFAIHMMLPDGSRVIDRIGGLLQLEDKTK